MVCVESKIELTGKSLAPVLKMAVIGHFLCSNLLVQNFELTVGHLV